MGARCTVTDINVKGVINWQTGMAATTLQTVLIKMVIVLDKQANGANCTWSDVYNGTTPFSPRNLTNSQRFEVLKEWMLQPTVVATGTADNWASAAISCTSPPTKFKFNKKCNIPLEFSSTTGAITEIRSNNITLMAVSYAGDDIHTLTGTFRVKFRD